MTISAQVIEDSIHGKHRITTFLLTYPRFIHVELGTHRAFSRNAASSRAIPISKNIKSTWDNIAYPLDFRENQKGMQAGKPLSKWRQTLCKAIWASHSYVSGVMAYAMFKLGAHKQYANRLLEPTTHMTTVVTATEYDNFFALRCHKDAQPELQALAHLMYSERELSKPKRLRRGEWHLPFVTAFERKIRPIEDLIKISVARCARTSYRNHDRNLTSFAEDVSLYERLVNHTPMHASPAEHQATPNPGKWSGNFFGWTQYRKTLPNECVTKHKVSPDELSLSRASALLKLRKNKQ